jgi:uncharacterized membrane protein YqhA
MRKFIYLFSWVRMLMLMASVGSVLAALLMFFVGFDHLLHTAVLFVGTEHSGSTLYKHVTIGVLESVDAFLFGLVFIIFAFAIAIGFVFQLPADLVTGLPRWMKAEGVAELKQTLVEVVIVGLIIIFAGVAVEQGRDLDWDDLVLPIAIALLAGSMRLLHFSEPRVESWQRDQHADHERTRNAP